MPDIDTLVEGRIEEFTEYLDNAPINLNRAICHDELYEIAYAAVMDDLTDAAESRRDEGACEEWDNE